MKIWVTLLGRYERIVMGVFSSLEKAKIYAQEQKNKRIAYEKDDDNFENYVNAEWLDEGKIHFEEYELDKGD